MSKIKKATTKLTATQRDGLIGILKMRFEKNPKRHKGIEWASVQAKLDANPDKLWSLNEMEQTGGEPDVVGFDKKTGEYIFYDCSPESPKERRSICYDHEALEKRKENKPANSAVQMATDMGIALLTEEQYRGLQQLGEFDLKTSSWIETPAEIRKLNGALILRSSLQYGVCVSQWCRILLWRKRVSGVVTGLIQLIATYIALFFEQELYLFVSPVVTKTSCIVAIIQFILIS